MKVHLQPNEEVVNGTVHELQKRIEELEREKESSCPDCGCKDGFGHSEFCTAVPTLRTRVKELERELDESLKTPDEWCRLLGINICDPDGWRSNGDPPWSQPLSYNDFMDRAMRSSQLAPADPGLLLSECNSLRAQLAEAQWDSERLDAVQKQFDDQVAKDHGLGGDFRIWFWFSHQHGLYWHWAIESPESHFPTVREAIDAAARKDEETKP